MKDPRGRPLDSQQAYRLNRKSNRTLFIYVSDYIHYIHFDRQARPGHLVRRVDNRGRRGRSWTGQSGETQARPGHLVTRVDNRGRRGRSWTGQSGETQGPRERSIHWCHRDSDITDIHRWLSTGRLKTDTAVQPLLPAGLPQSIQGMRTVFRLPGLNRRYTFMLFMFWCLVHISTEVTGAFN